ncbi:MAG: toxin-activating lysine-acyltransferase [Rhizobiales bacterium]|nr:toxin-activating lysine-acyltransferase [Hyphomicrobiales bacterium]
MNKQFYSPDNGILTRMTDEKRHLLIGEIVMLMQHSLIHRFYHITDIDQLFLPPIHLNQFRTYRKGSDLIGLVTWGWFSQDVEDNYLSGKYTLKPHDWKSGKNLWLMDFLAPFGHAKHIANDIKKNIHPNELVKAFRIYKSGKPKKIWNLYGDNYLKNKKNSMIN